MTDHPAPLSHDRARLILAVLLILLAFLAYAAGDEVLGAWLLQVVDGAPPTATPAELP